MQVNPLAVISDLEAKSIKPIRFRVGRGFRQKTIILVRELPEVEVVRDKHGSCAGFFLKISKATHHGLRVPFFSGIYRCS